VKKEKLYFNIFSYKVIEEKIVSIYDPFSDYLCQRRQKGGGTREEWEKNTSKDLRNILNIFLKSD